MKYSVFRVCSLIVLFMDSSTLKLVELRIFKIFKILFSLYAFSSNKCTVAIVLEYQNCPKRTVI